ncbi:XF1762 family protein [Nonomuraea sp. NPDC049646]|uniref:XF1762 family protein n=1 Tax=unclassified Nonomuraea TaxID=2593643 RepID=UPI0037BD8659
MIRLQLVPVRFREACDFVAVWHHHPHHRRPPRGHKFSLGTALGRRLIGVAIVGRPIARFLDNGETLEVLRLATDGTPGACSFLYARAWKAAKALGYTRLVTYLEAGEAGASVRGAGWRVVAERPPRRGWDTPSRPRTPTGGEGVARTLWEAPDE